MAASKKAREIEIHPDGWQRFERAMAVVVKAPPQHRKAKPKARRGAARAKAKKS